MDHLVALDGGWSAWRRVCLRSAGFPASWLVALGSEPLARAVDRLLDAEPVVARDREAAIAAGRATVASAPTERRARIQRTLKRLFAGDAPEEGGAAEVDLALAPLARSHAEECRRRRSAEDAYAAELARIRRQLREVARRPEFREALLWQNRQAVLTGVLPLLRRPLDVTDSDTRRLELLVASYLQRYAAKNDSIGFFGPIGWADLGTDGPAMQLRVGDGLLSRRTVYFEHWTVDALAQELARDPELRPFLLPRRHPAVRVEGTTLIDGGGRRHELPPAFARVLAACDGLRPAHVIAAEHLGNPALEMDSVDEVYEVLGELVDKRLATWTIEIPTVGARPERDLQDALARAAGPARDRAVAALDELEAARRAAARAAGDPAALDEALGRLDQVFLRLTGRPGVRRGGANYAARTLVYEDCVRDVDLRLGPRFVARLGPPLALLLASARWYTFAIAERYEAVIREAYHGLRAETGTRVVEYLRLWERVGPAFPNTAEAGPIVRDVALELQRRWIEILAPTGDERRVTRTVEELRAPVQAAFDAPGPGWPTARYHCPDVLVAAPSADAMARGEGVLVLGEVHSTVHSYAIPMFVEQCAEGGAVVRARELDLPMACINPVTSHSQVTRSDHASLSGHDLDLEIGDTRSARGRAQVLAVGDLVVEEKDGRIVVRTRDGRHAFAALVFFGYYLSAEATTHFSLLPRAAHSPRVTIDALVVARERWVFEPAGLSFCRPEQERFDRFLATRRWARAHGLPRFVFARVPEELKPTYIDLESPIYVELLARMTRKASSLALSEMLPALDQTWLPDAAGNTYTSELRIAAVDPEPWRPGWPRS